MANQTRIRRPAAAAGGNGGDDVRQEAGRQIAIEKVSACTCLKLRKINRRVTQIYDRFLEPSGLTITQFGILGHVMASGDGISLGALAEMLVTDPTTLTRNLRPLAERGLVDVARDPADRRRQGIWLSERGRASLREAVPCWDKAQAFVASVLGDEETARLHGLLDQALARLEEI